VLFSDFNYALYAVNTDGVDDLLKMFACIRIRLQVAKQNRCIVRVRLLTSTALQYPTVQI
jgi:hypothetical protein